MAVRPGVIEEFREAMASGGVITDDKLIGDGKLHRVHIKGDRKGRMNGWYVLYTDGEIPGGAFGSWRTGERGKWHAKSNVRMDEEERKAYQLRVKERQKEMERIERAQHRSAAERAEDTFSRAVNGPDAAAHPYCQKKSIQPNVARRLRDWLLVPMYNGLGNLVGFQRIDPDGDKRFLAGTAKAGSYCPIGTPKTAIILCEGYATGETLYAATGGAAAVAVAFDCGNLLPAAQALRAKLGPDLPFVFAADNDRRTPGNPGITHARAAAEAVGNARVAIPDLLPPGDPGSDFNDLAAILGLGAVRTCLNRGGWSAADLISTQPPKTPWVVEGILPPGLTLMVAAPKTGKSRMATQLAIAASHAGGVFSSAFRARGPMGVLYLDLEDGWVGTRERMCSLMKDGVVPKNLKFFHQWPSVGSGCLERLRSYLGQHRDCRLVIVDTLTRVWDTAGTKKTSGAYHQEHELLTRFRELAETFGIALILVHHDNKFDTRDPMTKVSGTRAMAAVPDVLWFLERGICQGEGKFIISGRTVHAQEHEMKFDQFLGSWSASGETYRDRSGAAN